MNTFASRLKTAMQLRGCSGRQLCEMINAHKSTISNYLNRVCEPKQERLNDIARVLNVNPAWLAGEEAPMVNSPIYEKIVNIVKNLEKPDLDRVLQMLILMFGDKYE